MLRFLENHTHAKFSYAAGRPDYRPHAPGAAAQGRTIHPLPFDARQLGIHIHRLRPPFRELTFLGMMIKPGPELNHFLNVLRSFKSAHYVARKLLRHFRDLMLHQRAMDLSNGNALVARLAKSLFDQGMEIHTDTDVQNLLIDKGRVTGLVVNQQGQTFTLKARKGVVLASGGFSHDQDRRQALFPHVKRSQQHWSPVPASITGDGLRLGERAGGHVHLAQAQAACWAPVSRMPQPDGQFTIVPHLIDRQKPGFIAVTRQGLRFVNEAASYHDVGQAMIAACVDQEQVIAFLIADHQAIRRYGMGAVKPAPLPMGAHLQSGYLLRGRTLEELAQTAGIDTVSFLKTVAEFNQHAKNGEDPKFGKGSNIYNRYNGDLGHKPNPCLAPIEQGPFYAVQLHIGELGTLTGMAIDANARVLSASGNPLDGLYACGNDASSVMAGDYLGGGATLGPGMTFGYLAACHAAGESA
jgi:succinate dehydrogenase/fumarate reductase flavoprotein subunit